MTRRASQSSCERDQAKRSRAPSGHTSPVFLFPGRRSRCSLALGWFPRPPWGQDNFRPRIAQLLNLRVGLRWNIPFGNLPDARIIRGSRSRASLPIKQSRCRSGGGPFREASHNQNWDQITVNTVTSQSEPAYQICRDTTREVSRILGASWTPVPGVTMATVLIVPQSQARVRTKCRPC